MGGGPQEGGETCRAGLGLQQQGVLSLMVEAEGARSAGSVTSSRIGELGRASQGGDLGDGTRDGWRCDQMGSGGGGQQKDCDEAPGAGPAWGPVGVGRANGAGLGVWNGASEGWGEVKLRSEGQGQPPPSSWGSQPKAQMGGVARRRWGRGQVQHGAGSAGPWKVGPGERGQDDLMGCVSVGAGQG